ncbi:MAG: hypothetical protein CM15mP74_30560 [Halieaceae bacterium]|nr:MAG: hypothetical protein CM15mP74_30560 [Halieaceae bacterium]
MVSFGIPLSQSEQEVTPRLAYAHKLNDNLMMYGSATRGLSREVGMPELQVPQVCKLLLQRRSGPTSLVSVVTGWMVGYELTSPRFTQISRTSKQLLRLLMASF